MENVNGEIGQATLLMKLAVLQPMDINLFALLIERLRAESIGNPLWQALKAKRLELAREQGVPPYVIFHDGTLLEILNRKPQTMGEMAQISGVRQAKLTRYGDAFLQVVDGR